MLGKIVRLVLLAVAVEAMTIVVLVLLVFLFGPSDPDAAAAYAQRLGVWVGPIGGFILCVVGGWLFTRKLTRGHVINGLALGATVAAIDIALIVAGGSAFEIVFVISNAGRLVAGAVGGWLAGRARVTG